MENLKMFRTSPVKKLADLKNDKKISAHWSVDGKILLKGLKLEQKLL